MKQVLNNFAVIVSDNLNPYENLALEKFLLENVSPGQVFLYLWRNERTCVCGRNQNIWKECSVERLLADGGFPARRLSGGGAVYHDLGNLNFTFLACEDSYSLERQLDVIKEAAASFGIRAQRSGRNDITADGAKFSGNAFYKMNPAAFEDKTARRYHHGTLMIDVDKDVLSAYLNVDKEKYISKGVDSVKSRVCNLKDLNSEITPQKMAKAMTDAFEKIYAANAEVFEYKGCGFEGGKGKYAPVFCDRTRTVRPLALSPQENGYIKQTAEYFSGDEWLYKNNIKFNVRFFHRFDFGDLDVRIYVEKGIIKDISVCSDAMDEGRILEIDARLKSLAGKDYSISALESAVDDEAVSRRLFEG